MTTLKCIAGAVSAALVLAWGIFTEYRMQRLNVANAQLKRQLNDKIIEGDVKSTSDASLLTELKNDTSK
jgi:hypothetical protein